MNQMLPQRSRAVTQTCSQKSNTTPPHHRAATGAAGVSAFAVAGDAGLGSTARSSAIVSTPDAETGEIVVVDPVFDPMAARIERFALQAVAAKFLPKSRTDKCLKLRQQGKQVQILRSKQHKTASYAGLQTCGSVWACPVCAAKISERRRAELVAAIDQHKAAGGRMSLLTLTMPHTRVDRLVDLLTMQAAALKSFNADRTVRDILRAMGVIGSVRALEVTHGRKSGNSHGWHPHIHTLQFAGLGDNLAPVGKEQMIQWENRLYDRWSASCQRAGLKTPSRAHGLKLDDGTHAGRYAAKWGLERELTKGHTKKATHGETPFDFLRSYLADRTDKQAGALFKEFAATFKGKRQLFWSPGLKKRYAVVDMTDDELAAQKEDQAVVAGSVTPEQWRDVLAVDGRVTLLQLACRGWDGVEVYLATIKGRGKPRAASPQPPQATIATRIH